MNTEQPKPDEPVKITYVTSIPAPYKTPRLNALAGRNDVALQIYYANLETELHSYKDLPTRHFDWEVFRAKRISIGESEVIVNLNSAPKLLLGDADAFIVGGWNYTAAWEVLLASKLRNIPAALLSENLDQRTQFANEVAGRFVPRFDAYFAASSDAKANLVRLGAREESITVLPYCIDVDTFQSNIDDNAQETLRDKYDIGEQHVVLYVGLLSDRKGINDLITAVGGLDPTSTHLLIVGDGPKRAELECQADDIDVPTTFTGNVPNQKLANYYALATVFVLPSLKEPWGLVQNESLACGTPVVTTTASGAVGDLILDGENGRVVTPDSPDKLRDAVANLLENPDIREEMARNGLKRSADFTPEEYAKSMKATVDEMVKRSD